VVLMISILFIERDKKLSDIRSQYEVNESISVALAPDEAQLNAKQSADTPAISVVPGNDRCFGAPAIVDPSCKLRNPDVPLKPSIDQLDNEPGAGPNCWIHMKAPMKFCSLGYDGNDAIRIALIGDSHAGVIFHGLAPYLVGNKWNLTTYIGQGCVWKSPPTDTCPAMTDIQKHLVSQRYDLVLTTAGSPYDTNSYGPAWEPVIAAGSRIAVIADNPTASEESIACVKRVSIGGDRTGQCTTSAEWAIAGRQGRRNGPEDPQAIAAKRMDPPLPVIDLTPYYCAAGSCPSVIGDVIVYKDVSSHVTKTYMRTLGPALVNGVKSALSPQG
jgi:hypothetical protein